MPPAATANIHPRVQSMIETLRRILVYPFHLFLRGLLKLLAKPRFTLPEDWQASTRPTFYVLDHDSLTERLLLASELRKHALPPLDSLQPGQEQLPDNLLCLKRAPGLGKAFMGPQLTDDLQHFWTLLQSQPDLDAQVIPVSFFWGRAPRREEPLLKILTAETWAFTGGLQRFFAILLQGRQVWIEVGTPYRARDLLNPEQLKARGTSHAANKSQRLLNLYFRRVRTRVLGPDLSHRRTLVNSLMASPALKEAIQQGTPAEQRKTREQALRYINEIASNVSYPVLLVLDRLLTSLWNRLYDGVRIQGLERIKHLAGQHTLVYLPCHRSHIDYLLLSYVLFKNGLMPPHIAAGINLNMPVIGPLLRRGGAFFMRRSFRDNPLYTLVFNEYFYRLLSQGHPVEFFVEGGRSRTGRTLPPRAGMLLMTLRALQRGTQKPLLLVPVYLGYEKALEGNTYLSELRGSHKKKESPLDLLRVLRNLRQYFGRVDVSFGQPLNLDHLNLPANDETALKQAVGTLCQQVARGINQAATLNRVNLVALALLANPHRALETSNLLAQVGMLSELARLNGWTGLPEGQPEDWIKAAEQLGFIEKLEHPLGAIYRCQEQQGVLLTWYRNNALHCFALPGLVAFLFMNQKSLSVTTLQQQISLVYPLLAEELFMPCLQGDALDQQLDMTLQQLQQLGLLEANEEGQWQRPADHLPAGVRLRLLGSLVQPALERFYLLLALLERSGSGTLDHQALVEQTRQMAQRLAILQGLNSPEYSDGRLFEQTLQQLIAQGWLTEDEAGRLTYTEALVQVTRRARRLFDPQLRHSLLSLTWRESPEVSSVTQPTD